MEITGGSYVVSIPVYEGPMDLLLHLVSKNRIEIHDIPIHEITDQYLEYLNQAQVFNLELGSSFFTMAATLLLINQGRFFRNDGKRKKVRRRIPAVSWNVRWKNLSG